MHQFGASPFYTVVRWHELYEMDNEWTSHNSIVLAVCEPKKLPNVVQIWRSCDKNKLGHFWLTLYLSKLTFQCKYVFTVIYFFFKFKMKMTALHSLDNERPFPCCRPALWKFSGYICTQNRHLWIQIYPWISTENLWIWIWIRIWMGNFISTASLQILQNQVSI